MRFCTLTQGGWNVVSDGGIPTWQRYLHVIELLQNFQVKSNSYPFGCSDIDGDCVNKCKDVLMRAMSCQETAHMFTSKNKLTSPQLSSKNTHVQGIFLENVAPTVHSTTDVCQSTKTEVA